MTTDGPTVLCVELSFEQILWCWVQVVKLLCKDDMEQDTVTPQTRANPWLNNSWVITHYTVVSEIRTQRSKIHDNKKTPEQSASEYLKFSNHLVRLKCLATCNIPVLLITTRCNTKNNNLFKTISQEGKSKLLAIATIQYSTVL